MYTKKEDVLAKLPQEYFYEALDDRGEEQPLEPNTPEYEEKVEENWQSVQRAAQKQVDGYLSQQYPTPFPPSNLPPLIEAASLSFIMEILFQRRGYKPDENPYTQEAAHWRTKLDKIGAGKEPLTPNTRKAETGILIVSQDTKAVSPFNS